MRIKYQSIAKIFATLLSLFVIQVFAQESPVAPDTDKKSTDKKSTDKKVEATTAAPNAAAAKNTATENTKAQPAKKMVQDATINLQTTITGNQEQPRVIYILPWQSPQTANVDFEPLDSQQKAVFSHVEREELRRELESAGEL